MHPINVPGRSTPIKGVARQLPPLSATGFYTAGAGFADDIRGYRTSGQYVTDQRAVAKSAEKLLRRWLVRTCGDTTQEMRDTGDRANSGFIQYREEARSRRIHHHRG